MSEAGSVLEYERDVSRRLPQMLPPPGRLGRLVERHRPSLMQYFTLAVGGTLWIGRRTLAEPAPALSLLRPYMLLGTSKGMRFSEDAVEFHFVARSQKEKKEAFRAARHESGAEIDFPFPLMSLQWQEVVADASFWTADPARVARLEADECHLREYCRSVLRDRLRPGALVYDPACSTGCVLRSLAEVYPDCRYVGADLSAAMVTHASERSDRNLSFFVADAGAPAVRAGSCHVLLIRLVNSEVHRRSACERLLRKLLPLVAPNGTAIIFGHTPVLAPVRLVAADEGFKTERCIGARPDREELFQFYVLRRKEVQSKKARRPAAR